MIKLIQSKGGMTDRPNPKVHYVSYMYFKVKKYVKLNKKTCWLKELAGGLIYRDCLFALLLREHISSLEELRRGERIRGRDRTFSIWQTGIATSWLFSFSRSSLHNLTIYFLFVCLNTLLVKCNSSLSWRFLSSNLLKEILLIYIC